MAALEGDSGVAVTASTDGRLLVVNVCSGPTEEPATLIATAR
jgi:hypothetical protein